MEVLFPLLMNYVTGDPLLDEVQSKFKGAEALAVFNIRKIKQIRTEAKKEHYDDFDDYLEIVRQFGYIVIFGGKIKYLECFSCVSRWMFNSFSRSSN